MQIKSAPTEVSAPKNADPNCRQTILNIYKENLCLHQGEFAFLPNSKWRKQKKGIKLPESEFSLSIKILRIVWHLDFNTFFCFCQLFFQTRKKRKKQDREILLLALHKINVFIDFSGTFRAYRRSSPRRRRSGEVRLSCRRPFALLSADRCLRLRRDQERVLSKSPRLS